MESNLATYDVMERRNMLARQWLASLTDAHRKSNNIARRTRRAARVEVQPLEEWTVALQRDRERVAHRRARSTMDQWIMALRTNESSHAARWATSEDQRATFTNLTKGRRQMGRIDIRCAHCNALHWIEECNTSSPHTRPNFTALLLLWQSESSTFGAAIVSSTGSTRRADTRG